MARVITLANWLAVADLYAGVIAIQKGAHHFLPVIVFCLVICLAVSAVLGTQTQQDD